MATFFMSVSIHDAIRFFHDFIKFERRFSAHTITAYTDDLEHFSQFLSAQFATDQLDQIQPAMIRSWMAAFAVLAIGVSLGPLALMWSRREVNRSPPPSS